MVKEHERHLLLSDFIAFPLIKLNHFPLHAGRFRVPRSPLIAGAGLTAEAHS
jgi:hypothetical protein